MIAPATGGDLPAIKAYLAARADSCMILRANLRAAGLAWTPPGAAYQAQYVVDWRDGVVAGVAGHAWNGIVVIEARASPGELAVEAVRQSGRPVTGMLGLSDQVARARDAVGVDAARTRLDSDEVLMALSLERLAIPAPLRDRTLIGRRATASDRDLLLGWRTEYLVEAGRHDVSGPGAIAGEHAVDLALAERRLWVVERAGAVVATCTYNAQLPDRVQIGGVFTPPALRGRGHARAVVAAALIAARAAGVARAVLVTARADALAAYRAIGFETVGRYAIVLLR